MQDIELRDGIKASGSVHQEGPIQLQQHTSPVLTKVEIQQISPPRNCSVQAWFPTSGAER